MCVCFGHIHACICENVDENYLESLLVFMNLLPTTVWHENFTVIKFYGLPLKIHLDEKLLDFNFTEVQFHIQGHSDIQQISIQFTDYNFTFLALTVKLQNGPYSLFICASYFISCSVHAQFASVTFIDCKWCWGCRHF